MERSDFSPSPWNPPSMHVRQSRKQPMYRPFTKTLREVVRREITLAFAAHEKVRCREIADLVAEKYLADAGGCYSRLIRDALTNLVRKEVKHCGAPPVGKTRALRWPDVSSCQTDSLPSAISVPSDSSDNDDVIFRPLSRATLTELKRHLDLLSAQITADRRRFHALREFYESAIEAGAAPDACIESLFSEQEFT